MPKMKSIKNYLLYNNSIFYYLAYFNNDNIKDKIKLQNKYIQKNKLNIY